MSNIINKIKVSDTTYDVQDSRVDSQYTSTNINAIYVADQSSANDRKGDTIILSNSNKDIELNTGNLGQVVLNGPYGIKINYKVNNCIDNGAIYLQIDNPNGLSENFTESNFSKDSFIDSSFLNGQSIDTLNFKNKVIAYCSIYDVIKLVRYMKTNKKGPWEEESNDTYYSDIDAIGSLN